MIFRMLFGSTGLTTTQKMQYIVFSLVAIVVALVLHEFAHALVAYWCGDKTAKAQGRLSLNPLKHIDPIGFAALVLFGFGWAKPVQINVRNYKYPRLGTALTAAAGPVSNFLQAFIFSFGYAFFTLKYYQTGTVIYSNLVILFHMLFAYNVSLGLFNLIPVPPLDGSKVIGELLPFKAQRAYYSLERFGFIIAIALVYLLDNLGVYDFVFYTIRDAFLTLWTPLLNAIFSI